MDEVEPTFVALQCRCINDNTTETFQVRADKLLVRFAKEILEDSFGPCGVVVDRQRLDLSDKRTCKEVEGCSIVVMKKKRGRVLSNGTKGSIDFLPMAAQDAIKSAARSGPGSIDEIFLYLGQETVLKHRQTGVVTTTHTLTESQAEEIYSKFSFGAEGRACLSGDAPHRIAAIMFPHGKSVHAGPKPCPVGFTLRFSRWVEGAGEVLYPYLDSGKNILLVGPPGSGKTTVLKDLARRASEMRTVGVVDFMGEICGANPEPYHFFHSVKRFFITSRNRQAEVIHEVIANHSPDCIVVDEVMGEEQVKAVVDTCFRGVSVIATVHGSDLRSVVSNPTTVPLVGDTQNVILSTQERSERNVPRKTCTERITTPPFDIVVEIVNLSLWIVCTDVPKAVDKIHREERYRDDHSFMHYV